MRTRWRYLLPILPLSTVFALACSPQLGPARKPSTDVVYGPGRDWVTGHDAYTDFRNHESVANDKVIEVLPDMQDQAVRVLEASQAVKLTNEEVAGYTGHSLPQHWTHHAFLVRAVAYEDPSIELVALNRIDDRLYVMVDAIPNRLIKRPRVVLLEQDISRVLIYFAVGA